MNWLKKILILFVVVLSFSSNNTSAQMQEELKQYFYDGIYFVAIEDYREALFNFKKVFDKGINNANINYYIGLCYIHLENEKTKAIPYLENASQSISMDFTEGQFKETTSPTETFFWLAIGYHIAGDFEKAVLNYRKYNSFLDKNDDNLKFSKLQITACSNAKQMMAKPSPITFERMNDDINNNSPNFRPVGCANDSLFIFMNRLKFYDGLYLMQIDPLKATWTKPRNINQEIKSDGKLYICSVSSDGKQMFFVQNDYDNYNIYTSHYNSTEKKWTVIEKFKPLSSKYYEGHASISADGNTIFFTATYQNSIGGVDIYKMEKKSNGEWGKPENMGINVNTLFNEESPFITADGQKLFFSSQGHTTMGGYDIFYCTKTGNGWSKPVNVGYPLNTTDDDLYFCPAGNGDYGYISRINTEQKEMKEDIYIVRFK